MADPVELGLVTSSSFPSGTGSFNYKGSFGIVVQNLAYQKQVSIWAQIGADWKDISASYVQSLPDNQELWSAPASDSEGQFVAKYAVNGTTYWDNNNGWNYIFPRVFDDFAALTGKDYPVVLGTAGLGGGALRVAAGVQNLAYDKVVGLVYTTDNWSTTQTATGVYSHTQQSSLQVWNIVAPVGAATAATFAIFYRVLGGEHWDNNFGRNYTVTPTTPHQWGDPA